MCSLNFHEFSSGNEFSSRTDGVIHLLLGFILKDGIFTQKSYFRCLFTKHELISLLLQSEPAFSWIFIGISPIFMLFSMSCFVCFKVKKVWISLLYALFHTILTLQLFTIVQITASTTHKTNMSYSLIKLCDTQLKIQLYYYELYCFSV